MRNFAQERLRAVKIVNRWRCAHLFAVLVVKIPVLLLFNPEFWGRFEVKHHTTSIFCKIDIPKKANFTENRKLHS